MRGGRLKIAEISFACGGRSHYRGGSAITKRERGASGRVEPPPNPRRPPLVGPSLSLSSVQTTLLTTPNRCGRAAHRV